MIGRLIKFLLFLIVLAVLAFFAFAYFGDLSPDQREIREPVTIEVD